MRTIVGLVVVSALAWGQPVASQVPTGQVSVGEPVTSVELDGAVVNARTVYQQVLRRDGQQFPVRLQNDVHLSITSNKIEGNIDLISYTPRGVRKGKSPKFSFTLEQSQEVKNKFLGSGNAVLFFADGTLINLRTYKGGAFKREITFARVGDGFACSIQDTFAREGGIGSIEMRSAVDGAPVTVISSKQTSSSCQVAKLK